MRRESESDKRIPVDFTSWQFFPGSLLKNCGSSVCEGGGCNDEARRLSISVAICNGGATKSVHSPRRKVSCWNFSTDSWFQFPLAAVHCAV